MNDAIELRKVYAIVRRLRRKYRAGELCPMHTLTVRDWYKFKRHGLEDFTEEIKKLEKGKKKK